MREIITLKEAHRRFYPPCSKEDERRWPMGIFEVAEDAHLVRKDFDVRVGHFEDHLDLPKGTRVFWGGMQLHAIRGDSHVVSLSWYFAMLDQVNVYVPDWAPVLCDMRGAL